MKAKYTTVAKLLVLLLLFIPNKTTDGQTLPTPIVLDAGNNVANGVVLGFQIGLNFLLKQERNFLGIITNVHEWIDRANRVINSSVKNLRLVRQIINTHNDIIEMQSKYVSQLDDHTDIDGNGVISLNEINQKWKSVQVSLGLLKQSTNYFQIFSNVMEDNAFTMDDESRVKLLYETYTDLIQIKSAMRIHIRRTYKRNRDLQKFKREFNTYKTLFTKS